MNTTRSLSPDYRCDCVTNKATRCKNAKATVTVRIDDNTDARLCATHYRRWQHKQTLVIGTSKGVRTR